MAPPDWALISTSTSRSASRRCARLPGNWGWQERSRGRSFEVLGPFARTVKHANDLNDLSTNAVGKDVWCVRDNQFARPQDPAWPARCRVVCQAVSRREDTIHRSLSCAGTTIARNVRSYRVQIGQSKAQPLNLHGVSTSCALRSLLLRLRSFRRPLLECLS